MSSGASGGSGGAAVVLAEHRAKILATAGGARNQSHQWGGRQDRQRPSPIGASAVASGSGYRRILKEAFSKGDPQDSDAEDDSASVQSEDRESSSGTVSDCSVDEIPVWIKGEQRWISGVTEDTTCEDLIEVLLQQDLPQQQPGAAAAAVSSDYCITERWRQVEQVLDRGTKIWQIWTAWGKAQPEVKFILRRVDGSHGPGGGPSGAAKGGNGATGATTTGTGTGVVERDRDSGRGSPTGSINSAIVRRKRHRAQKSTFAWMTHGQTIHPKSSKTSIERLMKLILEQGDIIQQQLSKLRDREIQISSIEEERHRLREREHGKNYLLETYLKGLSEATETDPNALDSGITSEATTTASPEMDFAPENDSDLASADDSACVKEQIKLLEKIVSLNKQIQREEESAVKLFERVRRYQLEDPPPDQTKLQLEEALAKLNTTIEQDTTELRLIDESLHQSDELLREKTELLRSLAEELLSQEEGETRAPDGPKVIMDFSQPNPVMRVDRGSTDQPDHAFTNHHPPLPHTTGTIRPGMKHSYPLYPIAENPPPATRGLTPPIAVGPGEPAKIVIASSTLPRNFQRPVMTVPVPAPIPDATGISVHQINKFIQCSNNLGTNCNSNKDDKMCPKQLFHSAVSSAAECQPSPPVTQPQQGLLDDLTCMGTLV
ncbi:ras association domain-containing protein 10 [Anopheles cruzii]|uniref:ras association domain-containing protein 10 n=1 Tax=Anopheles cruzii TaxID=68878 RepID=UPI0022EC8E04|nr:ras association domain-containing protein 10 [Anopheles cruzii]